MAPHPNEAEDSERIGAAAFVLSLRERGVFDVSVLRALETVPRDLFAPRRFADLARADVALPLACGQTMTSPTVVAQMLVALSVQPGCRVFEVGAGSGWVTALLVRLGGVVTSSETREVLRESALVRLRQSGIGGTIEIRPDDGFSPGTDDARYDRILLNGAVPVIPAALTSRLAAGGRLVGAISSDAGPPRLLTIVRGADGALVEEPGGPVRISPLVVPFAHAIFAATEARSTEV